MTIITLVNYGVGNLGSVHNMLKRIGVGCCIASDVETLRKAEKILLPGVGAFDYGMTSLNQSGMRDVLDELVLHDKKPTLGICLGAQMLGHSSEEGSEKGLGWLDMETVRFQGPDMRIPHMGWNSVMPQKEHPLFNGMDDDLRFYFVHSYHMRPKNPDIIIATTPYGGDFISMVGHNHIMGAQFHPEKSHRFGMTLLKNFADLC